VNRLIDQSQILPQVFARITPLLAATRAFAFGVSIKQGTNIDSHSALKMPTQGKLLKIKMTTLSFKNKKISLSPGLF